MEACARCAHQTKWLEILLDQNIFSKSKVIKIKYFFESATIRVLTINHPIVVTILDIFTVTHPLNIIEQSSNFEFCFQLCLDDRLIQFMTLSFLHISNFRHPILITKLNNNGSIRDKLNSLKMVRISCSYKMFETWPRPNCVSRKLLILFAFFRHDLFTLGGRSGEAFVHWMQAVPAHPLCCQSEAILRVL